MGKIGLQEQNSRERRQEQRRNRRRRQIRGQILAVSVLLLAVVGITVFLPRAEDKTVLSGEKLPAAETDVFSGEDREGETEAESGWQLMLVNRDHPLPEDYQVELTELANGKSVDSRIYPALQQMFDDARSQGIYPVVASGYRTEADQERIMEEKVQEFQDQGYSREEAQQEARNWVALPGTSEHQLGSAVDINADGIHSYGDEVYAWLNENSWRYGFIQRYPLDKTDITGISYEPWHYRYVGKEAAKEIYEQDITLEEYLGAEPVGSSQAIESDSEDSSSE